MAFQQKGKLKYELLTVLLILILKYLQTGQLYLVDLKSYFYFLLQFHLLMKLSLNKPTKILLVSVCFAVSIYGFMIKLPSSFRHFDKELHALFYFIAAAFLNLLFKNKNIARHLLIFCILYLFGISIEYAQAYSNKFFHVRIHGRYDPEDVQSNLKGLIAFSIVWITVVIFSLVFKRRTFKEVVDNGE